MKNLIFTLTLLIPFFTTAQLNVETSKNVTIWDNNNAFWPLKLNAYIKDSDTTFLFYYRDCQYTQIISMEYITFKNKEEVLHSLSLWSKELNKGEIVSTEIFILKRKNKNYNFIHKVGNNSYFYYYNRKKTEKIINLLKNF